VVAVADLTQALELLVLVAQETLHLHHQAKEVMAVMDISYSELMAQAVAAAALLLPVEQLLLDKV
jgi:hypothetical protein